jgi:hypothetical protein
MGIRWKWRFYDRAYEHEQTTESDKIELPQYWLKCWIVLSDLKEAMEIRNTI